MFHIRWHKKFNCYYGNEFATKIAHNIDLALKEIFDHTRNHHYHASGKFKGIPVLNSEFYKNLPAYSVTDAYSNDSEVSAVNRVMYKIIDTKQRNGFVLKNQIPLYPLKACDPQINSPPNIINASDTAEDYPTGCVEEFGGSSQTDTYMSTDRQLMGNIIVLNPMSPQSDYNKKSLTIF